MSREEIRALDDIIGDYWRHMSTNPRSLIVQYCGHYLVRLCRSWDEPPEDVHFLVMRNLLQVGKWPVILGRLLPRPVTELAEVMLCISHDQINTRCTSARSGVVDRSLTRVATSCC